MAENISRKTFRGIGLKDEEDACSRITLCGRGKFQEGIGDHRAVMLDMAAGLTYNQWI